MKKSSYRKFGKRLLDLAITAPLLMGLGPFLLLLALAVRVKLGSPVLFSQQRPGLHGKLFRIYKFRTMRDVYDGAGRPLPDELRLTAFGQLLRATSLDELPELWNVIRGEMSLVGPRPLLIQYLGLYDQQQSRRHEVRPGVTGLAQVCGRNAIDWDVKFAKDLQYVEEHCLRLDLKLLCLTAVRVLRRDGIHSPSHATMPLFTGQASPNVERDPEAA